MAALAFAVEFGAPFMCASCGVPMVVARNLEEKRRADGGSVYCPNGHVLTYGKSDADKLREKLAATERERDGAKARAEMAERSAAAHKGKVTEIKNRVGNGVCPCCNRSFTNLRRHMHTKHPDYKDGGP